MVSSNFIFLFSKKKDKATLLLSFFIKIEIIKQKRENMNFDFLPKYLPYFNDGMIVTILISAFVVLIGTLLGIVTALAKISKIAPLRWLANIYIEIFVEHQCSFKLCLVLA